MRIHWKTLFFSLFLPLLIGALSGFLIRDDVSLYSSLALPPLSPPNWIFPIVWGILYVLMGVSFYLMITSHTFSKSKAIFLYGIQLLLNFLWSPIFFHFQRYGLAFLILVLLFLVLLLMIKNFYEISPLSAILQLPYLLWILFAGYLNLGIIFLNQT